MHVYVALRVKWFIVIERTNVSLIFSLLQLSITKHEMMFDGKVDQNDPKATTERVAKNQKQFALRLERWFIGREYLIPVPEYIYISDEARAEFDRSSTDCVMASMT